MPADYFKAYGKEIDLNRTPSPEPNEMVEPNPPATLHTPQRLIKVPNSKKKKKKLQGPRTEVGKQAIAIARASGHEIGSQEYEQIYKHHYYKIRKSLGSKIYDPKKGDPETQLKAFKEKMVEKSRTYRKRIYERKEAGQMTEADIRYFEKSREGGLKRYWRNPELSREKANERHRKAYRNDPQNARDKAAKRRKISKPKDSPAQSQPTSPSA
ncbi:uncharacterized protein FA14DRAFT_180964 [Meira miltonrushii]|uniref:Uncharacterized protein n=1 Tax=Meira miltonrushii TaxID=1280837 RepID=A0A316VA45_9BASI|nr:uncharacterized protein FA14DRAFT_180964 [Meira miltonrushii]PWN34340.1 hypothetical protein FA14DRAFT_180964 [Meira miltonrushii]